MIPYRLEMARICIVIAVFAFLSEISASKIGFGHQLRKVQRFSAGLFVAGALTPQIYAANALGPLSLPLSNIKYQQVDLCDGKPPIMPGQKAVRKTYACCFTIYIAPAM